MRIAVCHNRSDNKDSFSWRWLKALEAHGVETLAIDFRQPNIIDLVRDCDGVMWHIWHTSDDKRAAHAILTAIEVGLGLPVFPNLRTRWHFDEKVAQHYFLDSIDAPKIRSWVFWNRDKAMEFAESCAYPIVFKLSVGASATNVIKVDSPEEATRLVRRAFGRGFMQRSLNAWYSGKLQLGIQKLMEMRTRTVIMVKNRLGADLPMATTRQGVERGYAYFQEFLPGNPVDYRVTVIGNRAFGVIRHNRPGDFRASGGNILEYDPELMPIEAVRIAHSISKEQQFQTMSYDFLHAPDGRILLNELCFGTISEGHYPCPGYWDRDLGWHEGQMWLEEAHIEDFLTLVSQKGNR